MLCSVFTPTHEPLWLAEVYDSLQKQTYPYWEWLLLPNRFDMPPLADARVRVLPRTEENKVGALKLACCQAARGDLFVELDHDDSLAPPCLERLVRAAKGKPKAFLYSDRAPTNASGLGRVRHDPKDGWTHYRTGNFLATRCFPATPLAVCKIQYAPDHVRAWTRAAYEITGGHDPKLGVCDDLDLMVRTYLAGADFIHVPECLYYYRYHPGNTHMAHQEELKGRNNRICANTLLPVAKEWSRRLSLTLAALPGFWPPNEQLPNDSVGVVTYGGRLGVPRDRLVAACREGALVRLAEPLKGDPNIRFVGRGADGWYDHAVWKGGVFPGVLLPETEGQPHEHDHRGRPAEQR